MKLPWGCPDISREEYERIKAKGIPSLDAIAITNNEAKVTCLVVDKDVTAFIVKAVNNHVLLTDALKRLLRFNDELCVDVTVSTNYPSADNARKLLNSLEG